MYDRTTYRQQGTFYELPPDAAPRRRRRRRKRRSVWPRLLLVAIVGLLLWRGLPVLGDQLARLELRAQEPERFSELPENLQTLWEKNEDARGFVEDYWEKKDQTFSVDLSEYAGSGTVPLLMQWDERWGYNTYSGDLMGLTGCGPTCLAMAAIYLTGDTSLDPYTVAQFAETNGYAVPGSGTAWSLMTDGAEALGLTARELPLDENSMVTALEGGELVICVMGPGDFTDSGHFIVLTGRQDGAFTVNDPNSYARSERTWTFDDLQYQVKNLWALGAPA